MREGEKGSKNEFTIKDKQHKKTPRRLKESIRITANDTVIPAAERSRKLWSEIQDNNKGFKMAAEWLGGARGVRRDMKQDDVIISRSER